VRALPGAGRRGRVRQARRVSSSASLSPFSEPEQRYARRAPLAAGRRLSCSARVEADVVIDVPASSQVHRQVVRKEAEARAIEIYPLVRLHYVQVKQPDMHDPSGDLRRLYDALEPSGASRISRRDLSVLQMLQPALRAGAWAVTVAVHAGKQIIGVWPGCTSTPTASRSISARRRSPRTSAISSAARSSPRRAS
jgi:uncharacterized 2Fe-2S/4Fe-4S cluster protein (DUF4445 family)